MLTWTELPDKTGDTMTTHEGSWGDLLQRVKTVGAFPSKDRCPWLKLAAFGDKRSAKNSLRTNENLTAVFGVELDYDGGVVTIETAAAMLEKHGIKAALYPSPSSTADNHRWRVIAPLAQQHPPSARAGLVGRLNGALGGIAAGESFTLSQGYFFGATPGNDYRVVTTFNDPSAGQCVDVLNGLDSIAKGKNWNSKPDAQGKSNGPVSLALFEDAVARAGRLLASGDGRRDLLKTYLASRSAKRLPADELRLLVAGVAAQYFDPNDPVDDANINQIIEHFASKDAIDDFDDLVAQAKAATEPRYKLLRSADIAALPPLKWCVRGVLPAAGLAAGYGPSGSGKSFLFFDMAASIAGGERWFDCRVEAVPVVYLVLEGEGGLNQRVRAWETHKGRKLPDAMACVVQPFSLTTAQDLADMAAVVPAGAVVFIDTLNRAAPTADENSSRDMGEILEAAKRLQSKTGGLVVLVHHTGKDASKGLRGHSSLFAAMDAAVEVSRDGDSREWKVAKAKDGQDGHAHPFALDTLTLCTDEHGDAQTSCVVLPQAFEAGNKRDKLPRQSKIAMEALRLCLEREGVESPQSIKDRFGDLDGFMELWPAKVVTEDAWRQASYLAGIAESDAAADSKRRGFNRARSLLIDADMVGTHDGFVWFK